MDSVEAACLGVVQNYTVALHPPWVLFSPEEERMANLDVDMKTTVRNALLMKEACSQTGDDLGNEVSEGVWREVQRLTQAQAAAATSGTAVSFDSKQSALLFCTALEDSGCTAKKKAKKATKANTNKKTNTKKNTAASQKSFSSPTPTTPPNSEGGDFDQYAEVLNKLDTDGSISRMLRQEQDDPSGMMSAKDKIRFQEAQKRLACPVCMALVKHIQTNEPKYIQDSEAELIPKLEQICIGPMDTSVPVLLGIAPPPLPPLWTDQYYIQSRLVASQETWSLLERTKQSKKSKKRKKKKKSKQKGVWVERSQDPREYRQSMSPEDYFEKVVLVAACKQVVRAKEDVMAEHIRKRDGVSACHHAC